MNMLRLDVDLEELILVPLLDTTLKKLDGLDIRNKAALRFDNDYDSLHVVV